MMKILFKYFLMAFFFSSISANARNTEAHEPRVETLNDVKNIYPPNSQPLILAEDLKSYGLPPIKIDRQRKDISNSINKMAPPQESPQNNIPPLINQRLIELHKLDYQARVKSLKSDLGSSIPLLNATLSVPQKTYTALRPSEALLSEKSQTWWISEKHGYIVFQNLSLTSINGVALAIYDSNCSDKYSVSFRLLNSEKEIKSGETIGLVFVWPSDIARCYRSIDINDILVK
jgi:hypothetical protein